MANEPSKRVKPRIRKTAPTIRERQVAAQAEAEKPARLAKTKSALGRTKAPLRKIRAPKIKFPKFLRAIFRPVAKVLNFLVPRYFLNAWRELRLVTWPGRRESWRLTGAVFVFATVFGTVVYFVDKGLDEVFKKVILK